MKYDRPRSLHGFTLVELSIVLIIIGLIIGGVLVGRDLIRAAEIRAQVSQIEKYDTAVQTFRIKYNCLPGDCTDAVDLGLGVHVSDGSGIGDNGNGDGLVSNIPYPNYEAMNFWVHLLNANLITAAAPFSVNFSRAALYVGHNSPPLVMTGQGVGTTYYSSGGLWVMPANERLNSDGSAGYDHLNGHAWALVTDVFGENENFGVYYPHDAFAIDSKLDDGLPTTGKIIAADYFIDPFFMMDLRAGCANPSVTPTIYNFDDNTAVPCALLIEAGF